MDYKFTLAIYGAKSKEEAIEAINEMLDNRDFYDRKVEEDVDDEIYIEWLDDGNVEPINDNEDEMRKFVNDINTLCLHSVDGDEEYDFDEPVELQNNRVAKKFWVDDGNETVRIEVWQTYPMESWVGNKSLDETDEDILPLEDAYKLATAIQKTVWG